MAAHVADTYTMTSLPVAGSQRHARKVSTTNGQYYICIAAWAISSRCRTASSMSPCDDVISRQATCTGQINVQSPLMGTVYIYTYIYQYVTWLHQRGQHSDGTVLMDIKLIFASNTSLCCIAIAFLMSSLFYIHSVEQCLSQYILGLYSSVMLHDVQCNFSSKLLPNSIFLIQLCINIFISTSSFSSQNTYTFY